MHSNKNVFELKFAKGFILNLNFRIFFSSRHVKTFIPEFFKVGEVAPLGAISRKGPKGALTRKGAIREPF